MQDLIVLDAPVLRLIRGYRDYNPGVVLQVSETT